jgi:hypothetical protein
MGYRQRDALVALRASHRPVPSGFVGRTIDADAKTTNVALQGLKARGLARRVRHGWWEAS